MGRKKVVTHCETTIQVMDDPQEVLTSRFGLKAFQHGQLEVINRLLAVERCGGVSNRWR